MGTALLNEIANAPTPPAGPRVPVAIWLRPSAFVDAGVKSARQINLFLLPRCEGGAGFRV